MTSRGLNDDVLFVWLNHDWQACIGIGIQRQELVSGGRQVLGKLHAFTWSSRVTGLRLLRS